jgi:hypothetical protein
VITTFWVYAPSFEGLWRFSTSCRELLFRLLPKIFSSRFLNIFRLESPGIAR